MPLPNDEISKTQAARTRIDFDNRPAILNLSLAEDKLTRKDYPFSWQAEPYILGPLFMKPAGFAERLAGSSTERAVNARRAALEDNPEAIANLSIGIRAESAAIPEVIRLGTVLVASAILLLTLAM